MNMIGNIIVGMWFIPVALFILVPLLLFAGNLIFAGIKRLIGQTHCMERQHHVIKNKALS